MDKVVSLEDERVKRQPHLQGPAKCLNCGHTWQQVAPVGSYTDFHWSQCDLLKGILVSTVAPDYRWVCACGCDTFFITIEGAQCLVCANLVTFDSIFEE